MVRTIASRPHASIRDASHPGPVDGPLPGSLHPADVAEPAGAGRRIHSRSRTADRHLSPEHHGAAGEDHLHQLPSCAQPEPLVGSRLLTLLITAVVPSGPVVIGIDET